MKNLFLIILIVLSINSFAQKPLKNLKNVQIEELDLVANITEVKPGEYFQIGLYIETSDGQFGQTRGMLKGKIKWSDFDIKVRGWEVYFSVCRNKY